MRLLSAIAKLSLCFGLECALLEPELKIRAKKCSNDFVRPGGAAELSNLRVGDEILAINGVRLSSSLTQDDIVQLIVQSVIKGNLLLGIRRYGKSKKGENFSIVL